nr:MAG TPA: hypothetical protein [Caudoviricetes sp.]
MARSTRRMCAMEFRAIIRSKFSYFKCGISQISFNARI